MTKKPTDVPKIVQIAEIIEQDLQRFEALCHTLGNTPLNSEKSIGRARRTLQEGLEQQERLADDLRVLGEALIQMQERQQTAVMGLASRAGEIQAQASKMTAFMERFAALGAKAAEATQLLQALPLAQAQEKGEGATNGELGDLPKQLTTAEALLTALADEAKLLASEADAADLEEISREAHSLRQRLDSARVRLGTAARARSQTN